MSISIVRSSIQNVAETVEISLASDDSGGSVRTQLQVPKNAVALAITVTDGGSAGHTRGPREAHVKVRNPAKQDVTDTATRFSNNQMGVLIENPIEGTWEIEVEYGAAATAEINASCLRRGWKRILTRGAPWFSCKTCKIALKAFAGLLLLHLAPLVAAGLAPYAPGVLAVIPPFLLSILQEILTDEEGSGLKRIFNIIGEYLEPVSHLLEWICTKLGFCESEGAQVKAIVGSDAGYQKEPLPTAGALG
jgi:hypothetical protein